MCYAWLNSRCARFPPPAGVRTSWCRRTRGELSSPATWAPPFRRGVGKRWHTQLPQLITAAPGKPASECASPQCPTTRADSAFGLFIAAQYWPTHGGRERFGCAFVSTAHLPPVIVAQELGLFGRVSLLLEPLPPKPRPASKPAAPPPENKLPHMFDLQVRDFTCLCTGAPSSTPVGMPGFSV